jgi:hypothetical protein
MVASAFGDAIPPHEEEAAGNGDDADSGRVTVNWQAADRRESNASITNITALFIRLSFLLKLCTASDWETSLPAFGFQS